MKIDTSEEPRTPCAQAASACTARMFHCRAKNRAAVGSALLATPPASPASSAVRGTSSVITVSRSTDWIPLPEASVARVAPVRPLTTARPLAGDTHSTEPPRACTRVAKPTGTVPANDTMWRPVAAAGAVTGAARLTLIAGRRRAACSVGMLASSRQPVAATAPRTVHREIDRRSDMDGLAGREDGKHDPDPDGQQAETSSFAHAEAREHAIEHVIGSHHADQVVERAQRRAQVGRGSRGVHAAFPRGLKRLDIRERPLQRLAVARPGDHRLHVAEREQTAKRDL